MTLSEALKSYEAKPLSERELLEVFGEAAQDSEELEALILVMSLDTQAAIVEALGLVATKVIERLREIGGSGG